MTTKNENKKESNRSKGANKLYFLAWQDTLERLDTLILEIRHLQVAIIHGLREPIFYRVLRHEEKHLWGQDWWGETSKKRGEDDVFPNLMEGGIADQTARFAQNWIKIFPAPSKLTDDNEDDDNEDDDTDFESITKTIEKAVNERLSCVWKFGGWGMLQRRQYHQLRGLQLLKRQIFRDKLFLCRMAIHSKIHRASVTGAKHQQYDKKQSKKAHFLILRAGIMLHLDDYIRRIRDFEMAYNSDVHTDQRDFPSPTVQRRREIGIYMDFLSDRTRDIRRDMDLLVRSLPHFKKLTDKGIEIPTFANTSTIYHRWAHEFNSHTETLDSDIESALGETDKLTSLRFVNTSYFMPERPDIQPVIANRVAQDILNTYWDNFSTQGFAVSQDKFSELMVHLNMIFNNFEAWPGLHSRDYDRQWIDGMLSTIARDFLAISVKGFSYIYALYLGNIGLENGKVLQSSNGLIELSNITDLRGSPTRYVMERDWYIRLNLAVHWLELIHHDKGKGNNLHPVDSQLLRGIKHVCDDLADFLNEMLPESRLEMKQRWEEITTKLKNAVEDSSIIHDIKKWRDKRSKESNRDSTDASQKKKTKDFPHGMARLDRPVRDFLYQIQRDMKFCKNRPLWKQNEEPEHYTEMNAQFHKYYDICHQVKSLVTEEDDDSKVKPPAKKEDYPRSTLYRHLYDIPWQSALMRATDILYDATTDGDKISHISLKDLFDQLHNTFPLGRELFAIGLEFIMHQNEPPSSRIQLVIPLIQEIIRANEVQALLIQNLNDWINGKGTNKSIEKILDELILNSKTQDYKEIRKTEEEIGQKLKDLLTIINNTEKQLIPLIKYLQIREKTDDMDKIKNFYNVLQKSLTKSKEYNGKDKVKKHENKDIHRRSLQVYITSRIMTAGSYSILTEEKGAKDGAALPLWDIVGTGMPGTLTDCNDKAKKTRTFTLIGRYDLFQITNTRSMCRCPIPFFPGTDQAQTTIWVSNNDAKDIITKQKNTYLYTGSKNKDFFDDLSGVGSNPTKQKYDQVAVIPVSADQERFPTFFLRREMVFAIDLSGQGLPMPPEPCKPTIAILSISLQKRSLRLDFLYRLINARSKNGSYLCTDGIKLEQFRNPKKERKIPRILEQAACWLTDDDYALLTDGWGDIQIIFTGDLVEEKKKAEKGDKISRVEEIFLIQNALFQDFLVDRTELTFTDQVIERHISEPESKFHFSTELRVMEDRLLSYGNDKFMEDFKNARNDLCDHEQQRISLSKIPGRLDFAVNYQQLSKKCGDANSLKKNYIELFKSKYLDRLDTSIAYKVIEEKKLDDD